MWMYLADLVPKDMEQAVTRVPFYSRARGDTPTFRRWLWMCPGCTRKVRTVYYPLPPITLTEFYGIDPAVIDADEAPKPLPCFACHRCHDVRFFSRVDSDA